jgi:hypothetical protein
MLANRPFLTRWCRRLVLALIAAVLLVAVPGARADDRAEDLPKEMADVAGAIVKQLQDKKLPRAVAVGLFTASDKLKNPSSAGPALQKALEEELTKRQVKIDPKADAEISGHYYPEDDEPGGRVIGMMELRLVDRPHNDELMLVEKKISGEGILATLFGTTAVFPTKTTNKARDLALLKPGAPRLDGATVFAGKDSPFGIAVLVWNGKTFEPRQPVIKGDGLAYVELRRDDIYKLRVVNNSPYDVGLTLSIDGLNLFAFSDNPGYRALGKVVVPPRTPCGIPGWHLTDEKSSQFKVVEYAAGAGPELKSGAAVGTITANFCFAWPKDSPPPEGEPLSRGGLRTGRGPVIDYHYEPVERAFGVLRATVSIRYTK